MPNKGKKTHGKVHFNNRYSFERDSCQWVLYEQYTGMDRDTGAAKQHTKVNYHSTLEQIAGYIIEKELGRCDSLEEIIELLKTTKHMLTVNIAEMDTQAPANTVWTVPVG